MIKVGCCGFPVSKKEYYKTFTTVEIQQTFYQLPDIKLAKKWRSEAPENFEFIIKAPQLITHLPTSPTYKRLKEKIQKKQNYGFFKPTKEVFEVLERTIEFCENLKSNKILFQSPNSFKSIDENKKNLINFFSEFKKYKTGIIAIWEPRDEWEDSDVKSILLKFDFIHCVDPMIKKPTCGDFNYFRLHGQYQGNKIIYNYTYTDEELKKIFKSCNKKINYVMFNNIKMFDDANRFKMLIK